MIRTILVLGLLAGMAACGSAPQRWTPEEKERIGENADAGKMRVYRIDRADDSLFLRRRAQELHPEDLLSSSYRILKERLLRTVNDPADPGVGIAAPQAGISRRLIAVQRFDRDSAFRFYANPRLGYRSPQQAWGPEGCLSVPERTDSVLRAREIVVSYVDDVTLETRRDTVRGFTAVIFQHEIDHLDGILFIDRAAGGGMVMREPADSVPAGLPEP